MPTTPTAWDYKRAAGLRDELLEVLESMLDEFSLSVETVAATLMVDIKAVHRAREAQDEALREGSPIEPGSLEALPWLQVGARFKYTPRGVLEYLEHRANEGRIKIVMINAAKEKSVSYRPAHVSGFATWLATATADEAWPFSIQPDGRPIDVVYAIVAGLTTDEAANLTPREFAEKLAHAASNAFHADEARQLRILVEEADPVEGKDGSSAEAEGGGKDHWGP